MGLFVTDARDAPPTRRRTSRHRPVGENTPARHRNARGIPVRPPNPLRGPIRQAISGYRYYNPELGRWLNRDPLGDHASDGARELHGNIALDMAMAAVRSMSIALNEDVEPSLRLTAAIDAAYWLEGIRVLQSGDPSFNLRWHDPTTGEGLSNDPIGISGGLNLYVTCHNNTVISVDLIGLLRREIASFKAAIIDGRPMVQRRTMEWSRWSGRGAASELPGSRTGWEPAREEDWIWFTQETECRWKVVDYGMAAARLFGSRVEGEAKGFALFMGAGAGSGLVVVAAPVAYGAVPTLSMDAKARIFAAILGYKATGQPFDIPRMVHPIKEGVKALVELVIK